MFFSGGLGAMGYSLPAAIGVYYGSRRPVVSFNGDGGLQMNIQELQFVAREKLPIAIVVFNNHALGMIRHFQEMYFDSNYTQTVSGKGYEDPIFEKIAEAYSIKYGRIGLFEEIDDELFNITEPILIEVCFDKNTETQGSTASLYSCRIRYGFSLLYARNRSVPPGTRTTVSQ